VGTVVFRVLWLLPMLGLVSLLAFMDKACHEKELLVSAGNFLRIIIPCLGCYISLIKKDRIGIKQFFHSILATVLVTYAIKWATYSMNIGIRPSGDTKSFPSGHASCSFQGALFLCKRYGPKWGVPMLVLASLVAYSRVYGQYHHWRDVIAGFWIAFLANKLFVTSSRSDQWALPPGLP
jgi:membrane-associated phospholipid phosphatase